MSEELAQKAAERVREVIAEAEQRASEIVERAEAEAREKIERARRALSELAGDGPEPTEHPPPRPEAASPPPEPEKAPPPPPVPPPSADAAPSDDSTARLTAMKMALDGRSREEIAAELDSKFGSSDRGPLLDDVIARAGR